MRAYCATTRLVCFVMEHGRARRRVRRTHAVPYDQYMRRYDAGRARAEARMMIRAEIREYCDGLTAEARERREMDMADRPFVYEEISYL